jgi:hypothetical protein
MLESHLQSDQAPPDEQCMMMADVVANLGGMVLGKNQEADPTSPRRSSH